LFIAVMSHDGNDSTMGALNGTELPTSASKSLLLVSLLWALNWTM